MLDICRGPSVTRYELQPQAGIKVSRITSLADDIALNLATAGVRIEAPIPGKPAVGIEVPNKIRSTVNIRAVFESQNYINMRSPADDGPRQGHCRYGAGRGSLQDAPPADCRFHRQR